MQGSEPSSTKTGSLPKGWITAMGIAIRPQALFGTAEICAGVSFIAIGIVSVATGVIAAYATSGGENGLLVEAVKTLGCLTAIPFLTFKIVGGLVVPHMGSGEYFQNSSKTLGAVTLNAVRIAVNPASAQLERVAVVTGSSGGLGLVNAAWLMASGYTVVFACRSQSRAEAAIEQATTLATGYRSRIAKKNSNVTLLPQRAGVFLQLDLDSLEKVTAFVATFKKWMSESEQGSSIPRRLEIFVNNAGMAEHSFGGYNSDGLETVMATNHVAPYLLSRLIISEILIPQYLDKSLPSDGNTSGEVCRFVTISSLMHQTTPIDLASTIKKGAMHSTLKDILTVCYDKTATRETHPIFKKVKNMYAISKFANITLARAIPRWFEEELNKKGGRTSNSAAPFLSSVAVHPGGVATEIFRHQKGPTKKALNYALSYNLMKTPEQGALTQVWASTRLHCEEEKKQPVDGPTHNFRGEGNARYVADCHDGHNSILSFAAQDESVHRIIEEETNKLLKAYITL